MTTPRSQIAHTRTQAVVCLTVGALLWPAATAEAQARARRQARPSVTAGVVTGSLVRSVRELSLRIAVEVPSGHHGYLDKGDDGFFIPFSFSFPGIEKTGVVVEVSAAPAGVRDDDVRAQVLRGRAEFGFRFVPSPHPVVGTADLRYQICNDVTGICYPPRVLSIPLAGQSERRRR